MSDKFDAASLKQQYAFNDLRKQLAERDAEIAALTNPSDGRCMEIGALQGRFAEQVNCISELQNSNLELSGRIVELEAEVTFFKKVNAEHVEAFKRERQVTQILEEALVKSMWHHNYLNDYSMYEGERICREALEAARKIRGEE